MLPAVQLHTVPEPSLFRPPNLAADRCSPTAPVPFPVRYRPQLPDSPITQAVPLPLAGSPVTPNAVPLLSVGSVSLTDANGFTCLMVQAASPLLWPQYFGVLAAPNAANPANFDLSVVFNPAGRPRRSDRSGAPGTVHRSYSDARHRQLRRHPAQRIVAVPPRSFRLHAAGRQPHRISQRADHASEHRHGRTGGRGQHPLSDPPAVEPAVLAAAFGVLAQGELQTPTLFNLLLLYQPPSGGVGVQLPIVVEQFNTVSLANVATTFAADSDLISVRSFEQEPNPSLSAYDADAL